MFTLENFPISDALIVSASGLEVRVTASTGAVKRVLHAEYHADHFAARDAAREAFDLLRSDMREARYHGAAFSEVLLHC
jgi:hypothetical protein